VIRLEPITLREFLKDFGTGKARIECRFSTLAGTNPQVLAFRSAPAEPARAEIPLVLASQPNPPQRDAMLNSGTRQARVSAR